MILFDIAVKAFFFFIGAIVIILLIGAAGVKEGGKICTGAMKTRTDWKRG